MQVYFQSLIRSYFPRVPIILTTSVYIYIYITDPRLLGALRKLCWGVDETHLSVFHSASNRAHGERSRNSVSGATRKNSSL